MILILKCQASQNVEGNPKMDDEMKEYSDQSSLISELMQIKEHIKAGDDDIAFKMLDSCIKRLENDSPNKKEDMNQMRQSMMANRDSKMMEAFRK